MGTSNHKKGKQGKARGGGLVTTEKNKTKERREGILPEAIPSIHCVEGQDPKKKAMKEKKESRIINNIKPSDILLWVNHRWGDWGKEYKPKEKVGQPRKVHSPLG